MKQLKWLTRELTNAIHCFLVLLLSCVKLVKNAVGQLSWLERDWDDRWHFTKKQALRCSTCIELNQGNILFFILLCLDADGWATMVQIKESIVTSHAFSTSAPRHAHSAQLSFIYKPADVVCRMSRILKIKVSRCHAFI